MTLESTPNALGQPVGLVLDNWRGCAPPPREPMSGRYCSLRITDADADAGELYRAFAADAEQRNWTYLPYGPFATADDFHAWLARACAGDDPLFHTVVDGEGRPVGLATYLRVDPEPGVIEVGHIHFSPLMQRSPVATEAMYLMMRRVFDELGYRRYEWKCNALNGPSRDAAERLGFQFEGVFRQAAVSKGRNRDTAWYSILDREWPRLRAAFEYWLAPENFDGDGRQRRSLAQCRPPLEDA